MIEPKRVDTNDYFRDWWTTCEPGFYIYDIAGPDFRLGIIEGGELSMELIRYSGWNPDGAVSLYYYLDHGEKITTSAGIMDFLFQNHPDVAEWFLFHPELL